MWLLIGIGMLVKSSSLGSLLGFHRDCVEMKH